MVRKIFSWVLFIVFFFSPSWYASAEVHQYIDEEGTIVVTIKGSGTSKSAPRRKSLPPRRRDVRYFKDVDYEYYALKGATFAEMLTSVEQVGPYDKKIGRRVPAQTRWWMDWSYDYRYSYAFDHDENVISVDVDIYDVRFNTNIKVILPEIKDESALEEHDRAHWDNYLKTLIEHENDHVRIIHEGISVDDFIQDVTSLDSLVLEYNGEENVGMLIKQAVEQETGSIGSWWFDEVKRLNDRYDKITRHGQKHELRDRFFPR